MVKPIAISELPDDVITWLSGITSDEDYDYEPIFYVDHQRYSAVPKKLRLPPGKYTSADPTCVISCDWDGPAAYIIFDDDGGSDNDVVYSLNAVVNHIADGETGEWVGSIDDYPSTIVESSSNWLTIEHCGAEYTIVSSHQPFITLIALTFNVTLDDIHAWRNGGMSGGALTDF